MKLRTPPLTAGCDQRWRLKSQVGNSVGQMELPILGPIPFGQVNVIFPYINGKKTPTNFSCSMFEGTFLLVERRCSVWCKIQKLYNSCRFLRTYKFEDDHLCVVSCTAMRYHFYLVIHSWFGSVQSLNHYLFFPNWQIRIHHQPNQRT